MNCKIPPKVAAINSFAGYGRCSTTEVALFLSVMEVQACPVPTSVFRITPSFQSFFCMLTTQMPGYLEQWKHLNLVFDGIFCGFLGKKEQIPIVSSFIKDQKNAGSPTVLIDPVMGDRGKAYRTITKEHCLNLKELVKLADIITPNITEACLLTDTPWKMQGWNDAQLQDICQKLHASVPTELLSPVFPFLLKRKKDF